VCDQSCITILTLYYTNSIQTLDGILITDIGQQISADTSSDIQLCPNSLPFNINIIFIHNFVTIILHFGYQYLFCNVANS